jgi:hypothetical protein
MDILFNICKRCGCPYVGSMVPFHLNPALRIPCVEKPEVVVVYQAFLIQDLMTIVNPNIKRK